MLRGLQERKLTRYFQVYDIDDDGQIASPDFERVIENVRILRGASESNRSPMESERFCRSSG
jgi:Ca2+-binding EF-hand superfamily protein